MVAEKQNLGGVPPAVLEEFTSFTGDDTRADVENILNETSMLQAARRAQDELDRQAQQTEAEEKEKLKIKAGEEASTLLFQVGVDFLRKNSRLSKRALYEQFRQRYSEPWQAFTAAFEPPDNQGNGGGFDLLFDEIKRVALQTQEENPTVDVAHPEFPATLPEFSLENESAEGGVSEETEDTSSQTRPTELATPILVEDSSPEEEAIFAEDTEFDTSEIPQVENKNNVLDTIRGMWNWTKEQFDRSKNNREYQKAIEVLKAGGAIQVRLVDEKNAPASKPFWISATSLFAQEKGLTYEDLQEAKFKKLDPKSQVPSYFLEESGVRMLPVGADEKGQTPFDKRMLANPVRLLVMNTGAENSPADSNEFDQLRLGAKEVQRAVVEIAEAIETSLSIMEELVKPVDNQRTSIDSTEGLSKKEVDKLVKVQLDLARSRFGGMIAGINEIKEVVARSTVTIDRYGQWDENSLRAETPLHEAKRELDNVMEILDGIVECIRIFNDKKASKEDKEVATEVVRDLFTLVVFRDEIRAPLVNFFQTVRESVVQLYMREYTDATAVNRASEYFRGLGLMGIDEDELFELGVEHVPDFEASVEQYVAQLEAQGVGPDENKETVYAFMVTQLFGRYENVVQAGFNRIMSGAEGADEAQSKQIFDEFTNVIEEEAHRNYAQEKLAEVITPLLHRVVFLLTRNIGQQIDTVAFFQNLGVLPEELTNVSSGDIVNHLKSWLEATTVNKDANFVRYSIQQMRNYVGQFNVASMGYSEWAQQNEGTTLFSGFGLGSPLNGLRGSLLGAPIAYEENQESFEDNENLDIDVLLSTQYLDAVDLALGENRELDDFASAVDGLNEAKRRLEELLPEESRGLVEIDDLIDETRPLQGIIYSLSDLRDGKADGQVSGQFVLDTAKVMNTLVDENYRPIALQVEQDLAA